MNIKEYYIQKLKKSSAKLSDEVIDLLFGQSSEEEVYNSYKYTTGWKLLVLKVRIHELVYTAFPLVYKIIKYPQAIIDMVNTWEK